MESIFKKLEDWVERDPRHLLFSFLDLNGRPTSSYTYQEFLHRTHVIAGHLLGESALRCRDRVLLAYPPGLEMICAFFACVRAGLIPVPVYPPSSHGFQSAMYKMMHVAADCGASAVLTSRDYHKQLNINLARGSVSSSSIDLNAVTRLPWIVTEDFVEIDREIPYATNVEILFLQYTSGSTSAPKGVMVSHANILHNRDLVVDHNRPIAVSWLPQYHDMGLIGYYLYSALSGGTTYGFSPMDFVQRPALWIETIRKYRATASSAPNFAFEYCLRPERLSEEALEEADMSSLQFLMTAAEPVKPSVYSRFLARFQPYGLNPKHFVVAYGLAENTLAVSSNGRHVLSVHKHGLALGSARPATEASEIPGARQIVSCGHPLGDNEIRIVDPDKHLALDKGQVGEIWISGKSKCLGYWNNPELTRHTFHARIVGESQNGHDYLRTGDMGFFHQGELYVCGRSKDLIIIRGQNYYPQDVETIVESASTLIRPGCVAAFEIHEDREAALAIVAEVKSLKALPDPLAVAAAVRNYLNVEPGLIVFIAPRAIPKTSSGKIMRHMAKRMWMEGSFKVLQNFTRTVEPAHGANGHGLLSPLDRLKLRYNLTGNEPYSLIEAGMDSLDLVIFMHEIKELLKDKGADQLAGQVDTRLIQQISIADLFLVAHHLENTPELAMKRIRSTLENIQEEHRKVEREMMHRDRKLSFRPSATKPPALNSGADGILLTGGTGFVGPFLLKSLLEQTAGPLYVLIRAASPAQGKERLRSALDSVGPSVDRFLPDFEARVIPVCGDLSRPNLGLDSAQWDLLAGAAGTIYHNAAAVNYLFNYDRMRASNITGTNEILRLAFAGRQSIFNYISTTFIFGWATKEVLHETDCNESMELLDFGYSQSKWVAEQIVMDSVSQGLTARIFRPALVTPSVTGGGSSFDIAIRLLAFMVNHGIGVRALNQVSFMPADVASNNIVAIANTPGLGGGSFHVTRDDYSNMMDITAIITRLTGREFELFDLPAFVPEVIRRCRKDDLLYPLLDFLIGSIDNISSMEFKRYDSSTYQRLRNESPFGLPDPSLEDTVAGIMRFMLRKDIISVRAPSLATAPPQSVRSANA